MFQDKWEKEEKKKPIEKQCWTSATEFPDSVALVQLG